MMKKLASRRADLRATGFTLIELMITVAIIAVLAAIAVPSYNQYVQRSHRANAKTATQQAAQWLERAATAQGNYPVALPVGVAPVEGQRYAMNYTASAAGDAYTLTTSPSVPAQINDACGAFTLTHQGARGVTGTLSVQECWSR